MENGTLHAIIFYYLEIEESQKLLNLTSKQIVTRSLKLENEANFPKKPIKNLIFKNCHDGRKFKELFKFIQKKNHNEERNFLQKFSFLFEYLSHEEKKKLFRM